MRHARKDYDRIQDPENKIPVDEPVFLLRGQDACAPAAIDAWCKEAEKMGVDKRMIQIATDHAHLMRVFQGSKGSKVPDMDLEDHELHDYMKNMGPFI